MLTPGASNFRMPLMPRTSRRSTTVPIGEPPAYRESMKPLAAAQTWDGVRPAGRWVPLRGTFCPSPAVACGSMTVHSDTLAPEDLEGHRRELTAYCYRMLGSGFDAEDAVQETLVRAWRAGEDFEGRSSVRSWLYRIATNVCVDMIRGRQRRARPMELGPSRPPVDSSLEAVLPEGSWISPIADERVLPPEADPAEVALARDSIRLAFVAALQRLPPRQRAALILCESAALARG